MNLNTTRVTDADRCEGEDHFTDFDGSRDSMPCSDRATVELTYDDGQAASYVAMMVDGQMTAFGVDQATAWEAYRAACLHDGPDNDPGDDPGRDKWGHVTVQLCAHHARELDTEDLDLIARRDLTAAVTW
jgi:hypothetical protein